MRDRGSDSDRLAAYFDCMAETLAEGPEFLPLMLMVALERRDADAHTAEIIRSHRSRAVGSVARLLAACGLEQPGPEGVTARDIASLTIACFDGAFIAAQVDPEAADLRRMLGLLHSTVNAALLPPKTRNSE